MTLPDLKKLFRKYIKVLPGGPATGDITRGAGLITVLDALAEELKASPAGTPLPIATTLAAIQQDLADSVDLTAGARYDITGNWNAAGAPATVFVQALRNDAFSPSGILLTGGKYSVVRVNVPAGTTSAVASAEVQAEHSELLATLAAKAANLYAHYADNSVAPFADLDSFLAAAGQHGGTYRLQNEALALQLTTSNKGAWPAYWDAAGSAITVADGETLTSAGAGLANLFFANFYLKGGAAGTGVFDLASSLPQTTSAGRASLLLNGQCLITLRNEANVVALDGGYYKKITGAGKYYLLGSVQVDDLTGASNVVDLRAGTGGGGGGGSYTLPPATATALGGVRVGKGLAVDASGVVSVGDAYAQLDFQPAPTIDLGGAAAQLLTLTNNVGFAGTVNRAQGRQVRVFLFNNTAAAVSLTFPSAWAFLGVKPTTLAASKKGVLTLECVYGSAEGDIVAGYVDQN